MPLDATVNFAKATVSAGYAAGVTSITLAAGGGARFPAVDFNAVWWNATDYSDPADDPAVEIVRVTAIAGDVLTLVRGEEGTADVAHNTAGKVYKLIEGLTSSQMDIITPAFALTAANLVWAGPASGGPAAPTFRALTGGDMAAAGNDGDVQFNDGGALGASAGFFNWDEIDKLLNIGGSPITPFPGLHVGPDESTLPADLQEYVSPLGAVLITYVSPDTSYHTTLGIETVARQGVYLVQLATASNNDAIFGYSVDLYAGGDHNQMFGWTSDIEANGHNPDSVMDFSALSGGLDGGSIQNKYAFRAFDQTIATVGNFSFKAGAGIMEVGDDSKTAGIHVLGGGAFDIGEGSPTLLWLDQTDASAAYSLVINNRAAGSGTDKFVGFYLNDSGEFNIYGNGGSGNSLGYLPGTDTWNVFSKFVVGASGGSLQVGDAGAVAGIHVQGAGAFDVDGGGAQAQLWLDMDAQATGFNLVLTNQVAGAAHLTSIQVKDGGDFEIDADAGNGSLTYNVSSSIWQLFPSLQVAGWISTTRNTAPANGDIVANEEAIWFDSTNAAAFDMRKVKTADGTVVIGGVGLNTAAAPGTSVIVLPTSVYGGAAQLLGGPAAWGRMIVNNTTFAIPLYTP